MIPPVRKKTVLICMNILTILGTTEGHRKSKKARDLNIQPPKFEVYQNNNIPSDVQITKFLKHEEPITLSYWSMVKEGAFSLTIIPCTSAVRWYLNYSNSRNVTDNAEKRVLEQPFETREMVTNKFETKEGLFLLKIIAIEHDSYVHIYLSTELGGPQTLHQVDMGNLRIVKRHNRKSVTVKWNPSLVDPQGTDYCLIVSTKHNYNSLCAAQAARYGLPPPRNRMQPMAESQTIITSEVSMPDKIENYDPIIICTGRKTHKMISNLKDGQSYYYNLFATNRQSNFTYPFGSKVAQFESRTKPINLKHGSGYANLKKLDGKAVFRYKVSKKAKNNLDLLVIPCGGSVDAKIFLKGELVASMRRIEGFGKITIKDPIQGSRYSIKILTTNREDLHKTPAVEIYATTSSLSKIPVPNIPSDLKIEEYTSLRKCDSVTIGWMVTPEPRLRYCIITREGRSRDLYDYSVPNQCDLDNRLQKSDRFVAEKCSKVNKYYDKEQVITQKIGRLKPGRGYVIQVTVKKPRGKTLSYELLHVKTKKSCKE